MEKETERLFWESVNENIQWIIGGVVAAMAIRISDTTNNLIVIAAVLIIALGLGTTVNFIAKRNMQTFDKRFAADE